MTQQHETPDQRGLIIEAFMRIAAHTSWREIHLNHVAQEADLPLHVLRAHFPSVGAILGGFARKIDMDVLRDLEKQNVVFTDVESAKERLFDVLMRRFDALTPYKMALKKLVPALKKDPVTLIALNGVALNAHRYMLAAAQIAPVGCLTPFYVQGTAIIFASTLNVWLDDDDAGLARTMAHLDASLARSETVMNTLQNISNKLEPFTHRILGIFERGKTNHTSHSNNV